jgi:hypothetical protein
MREMRQQHNFKRQAAGQNLHQGRQMLMAKTELK